MNNFIYKIKYLESNKYLNGGANQTLGYGEMIRDSVNQKTVHQGKLINNNPPPYILKGTDMIPICGDSEVMAQLLNEENNRIVNFIPQKMGDYYGGVSICADVLGFNRRTYKFKLNVDTIMASYPELAQADNPDDKVKIIGRGCDIKLMYKSMRERLKDTPIEQALWSTKDSFSFAGQDMYSVLWSAMAGMLKSISTATNRDLKKR